MEKIILNKVFFPTFISLSVTEVELVCKKGKYLTF